MCYDNTYFFCPRIYAKYGFNVSMQIHNGSYSSSENGYRTLGHTMEEVEFGYPSENESLLKDYAEDPSNITSTVGRVPIKVMEEIFKKHGGIDWDKSISIEQFEIITGLDK